MPSTKKREETASGREADCASRRNSFQIHKLLSRLEKNTTDRKNMLYLALSAAVLFLVPIFLIDLQYGDETRVAGIAAEMALDGDFLFPKLNGNAFLEYPPLYYAAAAVNYRLFGFIPFAAKLPAALSAFAGVLMLYLMMRLLHRQKWEAFAGAFMLATGAQYLANAYDCRVDMMLSAFCILSWLGFILMEFSGTELWRRIVGMLLLSAGISGGLLTKNLPGMAIPLSGIFFTLVFCDLNRRRISFPAYFRAAGAVLIGILPYALYLLILYTENGMSAVETIFLHNNFGRFSGSHRDHSSPFWHYLLRLHEQFPPYLPFLLGGLFLHFKAYRNPRNILRLSLLLIPFLLLSAASGKRQVYLLPLSAPAAMIAASALPCCILICLRLLRRDMTEQICRGLRIFAAVAILIAASISCTAGYFISRRNSVRPIFVEVKHHLSSVRNSRMVLVRPRERLAGASVFYLHTVFPEVRKLEELKKGDSALCHLKSEKPIPPLPEGFSAKRFSDEDLLFVFPVSK